MKLTENETDVLHLWNDPGFDPTVNDFDEEMTKKLCTQGYLRLVFRMGRYLLTKKGEKEVSKL
ncbi:MAG: hypothetical protein WC623_24120 [Pedobacter sp.]|uniref:hypothetical protein n=1 Tax=Pedobacter sp. TaxID=1411316 RepID=UPI00356571F4